MDLILFYSVLYITINGTFLVAAYLVDFHFRRKSDPEHLANRRSIIIGLISSVPATLLFSFFFYCFVSYEYNETSFKMIGAINPDIIIILYFGAPLFLYISTFIICRKYLFKRTK